MEHPLISIIIPVFNIEPYIARCPDSILAQTYEPIEIVAVDDGSKDASGGILDDYALRYDKVRVFHKENGGVTSARLFGIEKAKGAYIGFVDGDDTIEPEMYERLMANAMKYHADISHCGYQMVFPDRVDYYYDTGRLVLQDKATGLQDLLEGSMIEPGLCNKLYKQSLLQSLFHLMDGSIKNNEDLLMNYYLFRQAERSVFEDFCPYHYMIRKGSAATGKLNEHKLADPIKVLQRIMADCPEPELQRIIKSRMTTAWISLATMPDGDQRELVAPYREQARRELRELCPEILRGDYSRRTKLLTALATLSPGMYHALHGIYAKIKGTDKKYEV